MGVFIGASTKIVDRVTGEVHMGRVPAYSVVVPGTLQASRWPTDPRGRPSLRRDHQAGGREDPVEDVGQRTAARLMGAGPSHAVDLAQRLIRCPSVTHEGGALDLLEAELFTGFSCTRSFGEGDERIDNLFARIGDERPSRFCRPTWSCRQRGRLDTWCFRRQIADGRSKYAAPPT